MRRLGNFFDCVTEQGVRCGNRPTEWQLNRDRLAAESPSGWGARQMTTRHFGVVPWASAVQHGTDRPYRGFEATGSGTG